MLSLFYVFVQRGEVLTTPTPSVLFALLALNLVTHFFIFKAFEPKFLGCFTFVQVSSLYIAFSTLLLSPNLVF